MFYKALEGRYKTQLVIHSIAILTGLAETGSGSLPNFVLASLKHQKVFGKQLHHATEDILRTVLHLYQCHDII